MKALNDLSASILRSLGIDPDEVTGMIYEHSVGNPAHVTVQSVHVTADVQLDTTQRFKIEPAELTSADVEWASELVGAEPDFQLVGVSYCTTHHGLIDSDQTEVCDFAADDDRLDEPRPCTPHELGFFLAADTPSHPAESKISDRTTDLTRGDAQ